VYPSLRFHARPIFTCTAHNFQRRALQQQLGDVECEEASADRYANRWQHLAQTERTPVGILSVRVASTR
jgi:hypothetical protein